MKYLLFVCFATLCFAQTPTYVITLKVSGGNITVDSIQTVTPTPNPSTAPVITPTPTATPQAGATLTWLSYPNATNYRVYFGKQSHTPTANVLAGNVTSFKLKYPTAERYYVVVKPMDSSGVELTTSNEVFYP